MESFLIIGGCALGIVLIFTWERLWHFHPFRGGRAQTAGPNRPGGWLSGLPVWDALDRELGRRAMLYRVLFWTIAVVVVIAAVSVFIHSNGGQCDQSLSDKAYAACQDDHQRERPY